MRTLIAASIVAALLLGSELASAQTVDLATALQNNDVAALEAASASPSSEAALARGALAALRHQDEAALTDLNAAAADATLSPQLRRAAWMAAAAIYGRQSRFPETVAALEAADAAAPADNEDDATDAAQTLLFARTLTSIAPMQANVAASGSVEIDYDMAHLPRADVTINGRRQEAVLDTGANFSTITESTARRLGLRMLPGDITVGATGNDAVAGHLGVADTLTIGGGEFRDVVFIVLPDSTLSFLGGLYRIPAIVGFPVLSSLGRLEFRDETLSHSSSGARWSADSNLLLNGLDPLVLMTVNGNNVRMFMDSGAQSTHLTPLATSDYPALLDGAERRDVRLGGAGGARTYEDAPVIAQIQVGVNGRSVAVEEVQVAGEADEGRHGVLGQDVLQHGSGYVIDFEAMRFELLP
jgi:predicted aspartyl protease